MKSLWGGLKKLGNIIAIPKKEEEEYEEEYEEEEDIIAEGSDISDTLLEDENLKDDGDSVLQPKKEYLGFYTSIKKSSLLFPGSNITENPLSIIDEISTIIQKTSDIADKRANLEKSLNYARNLEKLDKEILILNEKLSKSLSSRDTIKEELSNVKKSKVDFNNQRKQLESKLNSNAQMKINLENEVKVSKVALDDLNSTLLALQESIITQKAQNEKLLANFQSLSQKSESSSQKNDELQYELEAEEIKFNQIAKSLDSLQNESNNEEIMVPDDELEKMQNKLSNLQLKHERIKAQIDSSIKGKSVHEIQSVLAELSEKHQAIIQERASSKQESPEKAEKKSITQLLLSHYQGDPSAINALATIFEWSQDEKDSLEKEKETFWSKSTSIFKNFRDMWSNWLISSVENE